MSGDIKIKGRPVWAEVHTPTLEANFRAIRAHLNGANASARRSKTALEKAKRVQVLAVVKGNGYGHGVTAAARAFARAGADWFGVTCADEGEELRRGGIRKPVLVMTGFWRGEEAKLLEYNLTPAVTDCAQLRDLDRAAKRAGKTAKAPFGFHLKIDTGMNRLGISPDSIDCFGRTLGDCPHLRLTGTLTHLASSEDFSSSQTAEQRDIFLGAIERMRACKLSPGLVHMANSAAVISRPDTWMDMVRPGAILYGYHQNYNPPEMRREAMKEVPIAAAFSFRARVVAIKDVAAGTGVGYNARFRAAQPSRVAIFSAGYADGLPRALTNRGRVVIRGKFASHVGVISMDLSAADVTGIEQVQVGDVVTVYGPGPRGASASDDFQDASDVARLLGTATSDLLCAIGKRVPRIYTH
ncbi:MAG TPA: alanine racemase [Candidatus Acidoferrales bacterium]|nr:alanine racemase [Candidatus Acidoferrales bacterium]